MGYLAVAARWTATRRIIVSLELGTCCYECLTGFVAFVLLEVLDEACCQVLSLFFPLCCVSVSIAWVKDVGVNAFELCWNYEVEVRNSLGGSFVDGTAQDSVDDTTCITDRNTLAGSIPTSVYQVSLGTVLLHLLYQLLSILGWVKLKESLAEASREGWSRLSDTALCSGELSCKAGEEVILGLLCVEDRYRRQYAEGISRQEDYLLGCGTC